MRRFFVKWLGILSILLIQCLPTDACTYFFLKAKDGGVVSGRSMEFYSNLDAKIDVVPGGTSFETSAPEGAKAVNWKSKYGFIAVSHFGRRVYSDGLNEKGLAAGALWFADVQFPRVEPGDEVVDAIDLVAWILSNFETVEEVKNGLTKVKIAAHVDKDLKMMPPLHHYVYRGQFPSAGVHRRAAQNLGQPQERGDDQRTQPGMASRKSAILLKPETVRCSGPSPER